MKKQFNLEEWLQDKSRKVVTRDGKPARIVCWDAKVDIRQKDYHIIALVDNGSHGEDISYFNEQGVEFFKREELFFADEEEGLSEFEKKLVDLVSGWCDSHIETPEEYINKHSQTLLDLARKELEKENSEFKPKFTYNEKDYSKLANKLIEFRNNTPLCSVSYRDGDGRKVILHYEKEILDLVKKELEKEITKEVEQKAINHTYAYQNGYENGKYDALKDLPKWEYFATIPDYSKSGTYFTLLDGFLYNIITHKRIGLNQLEKLPKAE